MTALSQTALGEGEEYETRLDGNLYNVDSPYEAKLVGWRAECFERLGFMQLAAVALATRRDVDRQWVADLIHDGATPTQVADIVL